MGIPIESTFGPDITFLDVHSCTQLKTFTDSLMWTCTVLGLGLMDHKCNRAPRRAAELCL